MIEMVAGAPVLGGLPMRFGAVFARTLVAGFEVFAFARFFATIPLRA